jgi:hypothetical protein
MGIQRYRLAGLRGKPTLQAPLAVLHRSGQVDAHRSAARIEPKQRLQSLAVVGQVEPGGVSGACVVVCCCQEVVQGRKAEIRHVHRAEQ